jgi:hypothetical protein
MKTQNSIGSEKFAITLSQESVRLLDQLAKNGIWGRNRAEVAARFVDRQLEGFIEQPKLKLPKLTLPKLTLQKKPR